MTTFSDAAREAGRKVRLVKNKQRVALAKKYGLRVLDFVPIHIRETMQAHKIPESEIPESLLPKIKPGIRAIPKANGNGEAHEFPLSAIPERAVKKVYTKRVKPNGGTSDQDLRAVLHDLLNVIHKLIG